MLLAYLKILNSIQLKFEKINNSSQNWATELKNECGSEDEAINEFFEQRFLQSHFSPRDFGDIIKELLIAANVEQLQWIANKGLYDFSCNQAKTIKALKCVASNDVNDKKLVAISIIKSVVL